MGEKKEINEAKLMAAVEAILFTMGDSVETAKIAAAIQKTEKETKKIIERLTEKYSHDDCGLKIVELEDSFQMCTKASTYEYLIQIASQPKKQVLTDVLLETLSIIAYKQPVTRTEIEGIRGVKCEHAINKLIEYNLVMEVGRLDAPGRPLLFGTTEEFLRKFGIASISDLPEPDGDRVSEFKQEAQQEIGYYGEKSNSDRSQNSDENLNRNEDKNKNKN